MGTIVKKKRFVCRFCKRRIVVTEMSFKENPFCSKCLPERIAKSQEENGPTIFKTDGTYVVAVPVRNSLAGRCAEALINQKDFKSYQDYCKALEEVMEKLEPVIQPVQDELDQRQNINHAVDQFKIAIELLIQTHIFDPLQGLNIFDSDETVFLNKARRRWLAMKKIYSLAQKHKWPPFAE